MKSSAMLVVGVFLCCMVISSQAFFFNDNMWMWMMLQPNMFGNMFGGGQGGQAGAGGSGVFPLAMLASGSDNMKNLGAGMLFSNMMRQGGSMGGQTQPTGR